jgi:flagellar export protein FliJ
VKRYRFPLQAVLRIRSTERDRAAMAAAEAARDLAAAADEVERRRQRYVATAPPAGVRSAAELLADRQLRELAADGIVEARKREGHAEAELVGRRSALAAAASAVKALEELEARGRIAHRASEQKAEAKVIDDLVVNLHTRSEP